MKPIIASILLLCGMMLTACGNGSADTLSADSAAYTSETAEAAETQAPKEQIYYLRTPQQPHEKVNIKYPVYEFQVYEEACKKANDKYMAATGYAVYGENGDFLYGLNNEYVTNMLYRAKYVTDFCKMNKYAYGSASRNPAITFKKYLDGGDRLGEKIISCDRLVGWVLYEMGYIDQPIGGGMYVWSGANSRQNDLMTYLDKYGYEKITNTSDFKAGDIVFVNPAYSATGEPYGAHVFICAGESARGLFYRYDHGSQKRIRCEGSYAAYSEKGQPTSEGIGNLFCVYRPTQTTMKDIPDGIEPLSGRI